MAIPRAEKSTLELARRIHDRIRTGLEWLGSSAPHAARDALLSEAGSVSDYLPGKPSYLLPAVCRERLTAYRRWYALQYEPDFPAGCRRRRQSGPDSLPEPAWCDDPE